MCIEPHPSLHFQYLIDQFHINTVKSRELARSVDARNGLRRATEDGDPDVAEEKDDVGGEEARR